MAYTFAKSVDLDFDQAIERVTELLGEQGFGVLSDIDVKATLHKKLGEDVKPYRILGACNPQFAHKAMQAEARIGTMLPCNVVVRECDDGKVEVAAIDPVASMQAVENPSLQPIAGEVRQRLESVINAL